jgi:hypothetical protein
MGVVRALLCCILVVAGAVPLVAQSQSAPDDPTAPLVIPPDDEYKTGLPDYTITEADRQAVKAQKPEGLLPDGDPYWGASLSSSSTSAIANFEADTHKNISIFSFGQAWMNGSGQLVPFNTSLFNSVRSMGIIPMYSWEPWQSCCGKSQPNWTLAKVSGGTYDSYIRSWATSAKNWGHPFFLRMGHEMNGNWYPWSERVNGNSAGQFVTMWRHVHNIFTSVGATNVYWVWCPNIVGTGSTPLPELYPGDSYVDWTCLDGYNWAGTRNAPWQTITQVFRGGKVTSHDSYAEVLAVAPSKPMMIGETASSEKGGSKAEWITSALTHELPTNLPQAKAVVWENIALDGADWPIETSPSATSAFANAIAGGYWEPNVYSGIAAIDTLLEGQPAPTLVAPGTSATVTLKPTQDTFVAKASPTANYGGSSEIQSNDSVTTAYLQFDLSTLADHTITAATLNLHTSSESWAGSATTFSVHLVQAGWSESTLTWNNKPALGTTILGTVKQPANPNVWYSIALDPKQVSANATLNIGLAGTTSDTWAFNSSEKAGLEPQLQITYQ